MASLETDLRWTSSTPTLAFGISYEKRRSGTQMIYDITIVLKKLLTGTAYFGYNIIATIECDGKSYSKTIKDNSPSTWTSDQEGKTVQVISNNRASGKTPIKITFSTNSGRSSLVKSYELDVIPAAAELNFDATGVIGTGFTVALSNTVSEYNYTITSSPAGIDRRGVITLPASLMGSSISSNTVTVTCVTKDNNGVTLGTSTKSFTVKAPTLSGGTIFFGSKSLTYPNNTTTSITKTSPSSPYTETVKYQIDNTTISNPSNYGFSSDNSSLTISSNNYTNYLNFNTSKKSFVLTITLITYLNGNFVKSSTDSCTVNFSDENFIKSININVSGPSTFYLGQSTLTVNPTFSVANDSIKAAYITYNGQNTSVSNGGTYNFNKATSASASLTVETVRGAKKTVSGSITAKEYKLPTLTIKPNPVSGEEAPKNVTVTISYTNSAPISSFMINNVSGSIPTSGATKEIENIYTTFKITDELGNSATATMQKQTPKPIYSWGIDFFKFGGKIILDPVSYGIDDPPSSGEEGQIYFKLIQ